MSKQLASSTCTVCRGDKQVQGYTIPGHDWVTIDCHWCGGVGVVPSIYQEALRMGWCEDELEPPAQAVNTEPNMKLLKVLEEGLAAIEPEFRAGPLVVVRTMQGAVRAAIAQAEQGAAG